MIENYKHMMDSLRLSEEFRSQTQEKIAAAAPVRRRPKALRVALIAACICLVLAGTVMAVGTLTDSGEFTPGNSYLYGENGWERLPYTMSFDKTILHPLDELNENARAMLTQEDPSPLFFDSIYDASEYFGVEILSNSIMLDEAYYNSYPYYAYYDDETVLGHPHCFAYPGGESADGFSHIVMGADYAHESWGGNKLYVSIGLYSERHSDELSINSTFRTDHTENYRSPNGLNATIVQSHFYAGNDHYIAYFSHGGLVYSLVVFPDGGMGGERTLSLLKDILDAFEFEQ